MRLEWTSGRVLSAGKVGSKALFREVRQALEGVLERIGGLLGARADRVEDVVDTGFRVVLSAKVPEVVAANIGRDVDAFLSEHGLGRKDVRHWIAHTGGPKVLEAFQAALALPPEALRRSWDSLREIGNLSSASVLFVLRDTLDAAEARPGDWGLLAAMGPGFASELVLLRW